MAYVGMPRTVPGFGPGVMIETVEGALPAEWLRAGDMVLTRDNGYRPLRWVGRTALGGKGFTAPVTVPSGFLGKGFPNHALVVSPAQRVLLKSAMVELHFATNEVLCEAGEVADGLPKSEVADDFAYCHLLLDTHEIILAEGVWLSSLLPTSDMLELLGPVQASQIRSAIGSATDRMMSARTCVAPHEAAVLHPRTAIAARRMVA